MDKTTTIEEVLKEWIDLYEHANLEPLLEFYKEKYTGMEIVDYAIEGNSIFITPKKDLDVIKISFKMDNWED